MKITKLVVAICVTLALGTSAYAGEEERVCSPGFYKNHEELWCEAAGSECESLLAMLNANCSDGCDEPPGVTKNRAADIIEFDILKGKVLCDDK